MKFTIEYDAFTKMLRQVSKKMPHQQHSDPGISLFACQARVFVECNQTVAGREALVLEEGSCKRVFIEVGETSLNT